MRLIALLALVVVTACGQEHTARTPRQTSAHTAAAIDAVRAARFVDALREADAALASSPNDARAAAVRALARYQRAGEALVRELEDVLERGDRLKAFDHEQGRRAWRSFIADLERIDADLAIVAADPSFALELCLACWRYDWNRTGAVDERDTKLFELEFDGNGGELAEGDPRRRPTYRFDAGDARWARAMLAFQRAFVELVLAYRWSELDKLFASEERSIRIPLIEAGRVTRARELVLAGLQLAAQTREAYLAETDDDREWVPSPRQKNYAMPLAVDARLYATWAAVIGDVHRLLQSEEGVPLRASFAVIAGDEDARGLPDAYLDLGRMLREPTDIVIDLRRRPDTAEFWRGLVGNGYAEAMRATPLVERVRHMIGELGRGEDTLERKLRYLFWLN